MLRTCLVGMTVRLSGRFAPALLLVGTGLLLE